MAVVPVSVTQFKAFVAVVSAVEETSGLGGRVITVELGLDHRVKFMAKV